MKSNTNTQPKRPYRKPALRVVKLVAKEVLGDSCKVAGGNIGIAVYPCDSQSVCSIIPGS